MREDAAEVAHGDELYDFGGMRVKFTLARIGTRFPGAAKPNKRARDCHGCATHAAAVVAFGCRGEDAAVPITGVHEAPEDAFEIAKHDLPAFAPARRGENVESAAE